MDELLGVGGLSRDELIGFLPSETRVREADVFYPVSLVWCMGFAWSSFVAQSTLLACCRAAGFRDQICLCDGSPAPDVADEAYALASDDVMHYTSGGAVVSEARMSALDEVRVRQGIEKHPGKDEVAVANGTCIGVDLCDGSFFTDHAP